MLVWRGGGSRNDLKECLVQKVTGSEQVTFPVSPRGIKTDFWRTKGTHSIHQMKSPRLSFFFVFLLTHSYPWPGGNRKERPRRRSPTSSLHRRLYIFFFFLIFPSSSSSLTSLWQLDEHYFESPRPKGRRGHDGANIKTRSQSHVFVFFFVIRYYTTSILHRCIYGVKLLRINIRLLNPPPSPLILHIQSCRTWGFAFRSSVFFFFFPSSYFLCLSIIHNFTLFFVFGFFFGFLFFGFF